MVKINDVGTAGALKYDNRLLMVFVKGVDSEFNIIQMIFSWNQDDHLTCRQLMNECNLVRGYLLASYLGEKKFCLDSYLDNYLRYLQVIFYLIWINYPWKQLSYLSLI